MTDVMESIKVENVVASSAIGQELDLETLADDLRSTSYNKENFPVLNFVKSFFGAPTC